MTAELFISLPGQELRKVPLEGTFAIGRGSGSDLILKDARVSRGHALLRAIGRGNYFLLDLGSTNGTLLNGRRVTVPTPLNDGDTIMIADCTIKFSVSDRRPAAAAPFADHDSLRETAVSMKTDAITILVVDIRNFTRLAESLPPKELLSFVDGWFRDASAAIESHGGVVDKFIGDAVMAYWLPSSTSLVKPAHGALESALELVETARLYNGQLTARHPELGFSVGCGIHTGEAMFGIIGSAARRDFTAIGDCVNVAFLLEAQCKELKREILVSTEIRDAAADAYAFEDMGSLMLKGKSNQVRAFSVGKKTEA